MRHRSKRLRAVCFKVTQDCDWEEGREKGMRERERERIERKGVHVRLLANLRKKWREPCRNRGKE